jgi:dTDP-4-dehydrorhamnose 3,5-epimerase
MKSKINGVVISPLKQIEDERGAVLHMLRSDSSFFSKFGEIYFSVINQGSIKAWKKHKMMTQCFAVPIGRIHLVIFDDRPDSSSKGEIEEIVIGRPDKYYLVYIPPMLWYGFKGVSESLALLANCSDLPHDPDESEKLAAFNNYISYDWQKI